MAQKYFAAEDSNILATKMEERIIKWSGQVTATGLKERWIRSYKYYYGRHFNGNYGSTSSSGGSSIQTGGDNGELKLVTFNHYRNLLKHLHILTTNQKPAFDVRAINSDTDSLNQAKLGTAILDAYFNEKRLGRYLKNAAEHALIFGKGFVHINWEPSLGKPYTTTQVQTDEGQLRDKIIYEGDVDVYNPSPFDVYMDQSCQDFSKIEWFTIRHFKNKFNLAARYTDLADRITDLAPHDEMKAYTSTSFQTIDDEVDVPIYAFYHKRTDAMPNGRYMLFANSDTILYDGPIPYEKLPLFRIVPGEIFGTTEGYTDGFDLMGLQEALNVLGSTVFSNQAALGLQNILVPEGCNIQPINLADGLRALSYNPAAGKPEPLQLVATPQELFQFFKLLESTMETLSGVNSVARGNPEAQMGKNSSGAAMALIQSMAVQFASGFQQSWAEIQEDSASFILELIKTFAKTERMTSLGGKHNKSAMASFSGADIQSVDRVIVEVGNPLTKTVAGRVQLADNYLEKNMVKTPQEYSTVIETGNIEPLIDGPATDVSNIHKENEALMDGKPVQAFVGDPHLLHCQEHRIVLADPDVRSRAAQGDPTATKIMQNVLAHIQEHKEQYQTQDPFFSQIAGEPPAPQPPPPPPGPPQGGPPPPPIHGPQGPPMPMQPPQGPGPMPQHPPGPPQAPPPQQLAPQISPPPGPR